MHGSSLASVFTAAARCREWQNVLPRAQFLMPTTKRVNPCEEASKKSLRCLERSADRNACQVGGRAPAFSARCFPCSYTLRNPQPHGAVSREQPFFDAYKACLKDEAAEKDRLKRMGAR